MRTVDHLRAALPSLGFALYAYEPDGHVTLEILAADGSHAIVAETEAAAVEEAFALILPPPEEPATSIFD